MKTLEKNLPLLAVIVVAVLMLLPFLGLTEFNTKGEPREAVVALSMLKDGNWVLPVNNGMDIPYKPPFFHYCIAVFSLLAGGVNEYTSRLPSALSLIALAVSCFCFYRRRTSATTALMGSLLLLTSFEVHRAGVNCRVDMLLTAFTVGSLLLFYRWWERGSRGVPVLAVLCMSGAVLTKGPVGFVLPCFVMGVFTLLRGGKFWRTFLQYTLFALLSCILPALWYVAAWIQGGQHFLDLVYEENIGRMTGSMSYDSHKHPFTYNFVTLLTGWAPWILLLIFSLATRPWKRANAKDESQSNANASTLAQRFTRLRVRIMQIPPINLFTWLSFLLVLFFYCLPSSKRSVYLLPCYPFIAMLIAQYVEWLWQTRRRSVIYTYIGVISVLSVVLTLAFVAIRIGLVPDTIFHGKHAAANIAMLHTLRYTPLDVWMFTLAALPVTCCVSVVRDLRTNSLSRYKLVMIYNLFMPVIVLFMAFDGLYQPMVLNTKSLRPMAEVIAQQFKGEALYQYIETPMLHFFGADFYLDDKLAQFEKQTPATGVLITPERDFEGLAKRHPEYKFTLVRTMPRGAAEPKDNICFYRFEREK